MVNGIGWAVWVLILVGTVPRIRAGQWIWAGTLAFCLAMILFSGVRGRYMTPAAPLLLLATFEGILALKAPARSPFWRRTASVALYGGLASIVLCNGLIWGSAVWMFHSSRFPRDWCGGDYAAIVSISDFLDKQAIGDNQIAVDRCMNNFGRSTVSQESARLVHLLTRRTVRYSPVELSQQPPDERLSQWAMQNGIRYYVYRPPIVPWRLSHFRLTWLQEKMTGQPVTTRNPSFILYELVGDQLRKVDVPRALTSVTSVPGLPRL